MNIHHFCPVTGEFRLTSVARESPMEPGAYLVPQFATTIAPPTPGANQAAVFSAGVWSLVSDYRTGAYYDTATGKPVKLALGESPAGSHTLLAPATADDSWNGSAWVTPGSLGLSETAIDTDADGIVDIVKGTGTNVYTVQLKDKNGVNELTAGKMIAAECARGSLSALSLASDANGKAVFTLTAANETVGSAVRFTCAGYLPSVATIKFLP